MEALIAHHLAPQLLQGDNQYWCENCGCLQNAEQQASVVSAPTYLICGLNRFSWDMATMKRHKLLTKVEMPPHLLLPTHQENSSREVTACSLNVDAAANSHSDEDKVVPTQELQREPLKEGVLYDLYAVVVHSGSSAQSGHYYCYAKVGSDEQAPWYLFNDENVSLSSLEAMRRSMEVFGRTDSPYILFYQRHGLLDPIGGNEHAAPELEEMVITEDSASDTRSWTASDNSNHKFDDDFSGMGNGPGYIC